MAETTVKQHFIKYSGTKAQFIAAGYPATYEDKIVFIKGGANGTGECIYTRGMYFANFNELITAYVSGMNFLKGVTVDGTSYNAAAGGGYVAFEATDPTTVGVNVNQGKITIGLTTAFLNNITALGTEITNIKRDYATTSAVNTAIGNAKTELIGSSSDASTANTIGGAKKYADEAGSGALDRAKAYADTKKSEVIGANTDEADDDTIYGAKAFAQGKVNDIASTLIGVTTDASDKSTIYGAKNFATSKANTAESNAKGYADTKKSEVIGSSSDKSTDNTIYGAKAYADAKVAEVNGVAGGIDTRLKAVEGDVTTIKGDYLKSTDKTELTGLINTEKGRVDVLVGSDTGKSARAIVQDEVAKQLTSENISDSFDTLKEIAEWLSSHPEDVTAMNEAIEANADAIEVLNGADTVEGSVAKTVKDAVNTVRGWVSDGYATKDQVNAKYTKPSNGIPETDLASDVQTSLGKADSAYQKPSAGIPKTDLVEGVQTSLSKADTAVQSVVSGSANGTISVDGTDVAVKGLGSAAYTASNAYATSTQGGYANSALQTVGAGDYITVGTKSGNNGAKTQTVTAKVATIESSTALKQGFADAFDAKRQIEGAVSTAQGYANTAESNAKSYADSQWEWLDLD